MLCLFNKIFIWIKNIFSRSVRLDVHKPNQMRNIFQTSCLPVRSFAAPVWVRESVQEQQDRVCCYVELRNNLQR